MNVDGDNSFEGNMLIADCFKATNDDWYPSYTIPGDVRITSGYVHVSFVQLSDGTYRTHVWGMDDTGMDFDTSDHDKARDIYLQLCMATSVNRGWLKEVGFVFA